MPNQKISELTAVTNASVNDVLPIVNEGATKKITIPNLVGNTLSGTMLSVSAVQLPGNFLMKSVSANNLFLGNNATGNNNLRNSNNFVFGINSANSLSASRSNVVMGADSTKNAVFLNNNIFLGDASGGGMGFCSGSNFTSISLPASIENNIVIGTRAGFKLSQASFCDRITCDGPCGTYFTYSYACGTSRNNIFLGDHSGHSAKYSCCNIMIGASAGRLLNSGFNNIFMGQQAGGRTNSSNNVFIGLSAGICSYSGGRAIAIGLGAGRCAGNSISIGYKANYFGCRSGINIGCYAGFCDVGYENVNIGFNANCRGRSSSSRNVIIGSSAGLGCGTNNCSNVIIGDRAGGHCTNNSQGNVIIGDRAGGSANYASNAIVGCNNVVIGRYAGTNVLHDNIVIGKLTGNGRNSLQSAIAIGNNSLVSTLSSGGACLSISIGNCAGYTHGKGNNNIFLGHGSGNNYGFGIDKAIEGCCNIFIGNNSGKGRCNNFLNGNINIGHNNYSASAYPLSAIISIGSCTRPTKSNQLAMGSNVFPLGTSSTAGASAGFLNVLLNGTERKIMFFAN
jgi:trimeric autotransporter adhesin